MNQPFYIIISLLFSAYIVFELIRINFLNKKNNILILGLMSLLAVVFGLILVVKFGLIINYGKIDLKEMEHAIFMCGLGWVNVWLGLFSIGLSILKFMISKLKK